MKLKDFITDVQRHSDTENQGIDAADVSRVLSTAFKVLLNLDPANLADVLVQGLRKAEKKCR